MSEYQSCLNQLDSSGGEVLTPTPLLKAIPEALIDPFPILEGVASPLAATFNEHGEWEWAVFANRHPRKTVLATTRRLCKKLRASYEGDDAMYVDGRFVSTFDLQAKSGKWPETTVDCYHEYDTVSARQKQRFVLCSRRDVAGFCTVETGLDYQLNQEDVKAVLELRAVFIDPEERDLGLSHLLTIAAGRMAVAMLQEFQCRLEKGGTAKLCFVELVVEGEPISQGGERFAQAVVDELEEQLQDANLWGGGAESLVCVNEINLSFVD